MAPGSDVETIVNLISLAKSLLSILYSIALGEHSPQACLVKFQEEKSMEICSVHNLVRR